MADRELKRNVRGQIVSYEAVAMAGDPIPTYSKVYIEGPNGGGTTPERLSLNKVRQFTDSGISELTFPFPTIESNINITRYTFNAISGSTIATSGWDVVGTPSQQSDPSSGLSATGNSGAESQPPNISTTTGGSTGTGGDISSGLNYGGYIGYDSY